MQLGPRTPVPLAVLLLLAILVVPAGAQQPGDRTEALLRTLSEAGGPPGFEEPVREIVVREMTPLADEVSYDGLGSVIARQGSRGPRVMVDAHMDELGGMVRRITPNGFLSMQMLGGWFDQALVDQRWIILGSKGPVLAVTGIRDVHVAGEERGTVFPRNSLFLDVGAADAEGVRALGISPGDPVFPDAPFAVLAGGNYLGKAWDDRVGLAAMLEAMRRLRSAPHPNQIFYAATVQEEVGLRGAHTAADVVRPEVGIALEGGVSGDVPGARPEETQARLGGGPGIFLYDSSQLPNRKFVALVKRVAAEKRIPLQLDLVQGYGDDSAEIQKANGGAPTVNLVVPVRYTHAHNGIMNRRDFDQLVELLVGLLQALDEATVRDLRDFAP